MNPHHSVLGGRRRLKTDGFRWHRPGLDAICEPVDVLADLLRREQLPVRDEDSAESTRDAGALGADRLFNRGQWR